MTYSYGYLFNKYFSPSYPLASVPLQTGTDRTGVEVVGGVGVFVLSTMRAQMGTIANILVTISRVS